LDIPSTVIDPSTTNSVYANQSTALAIHERDPRIINALLVHKKLKNTPKLESREVTAKLTKSNGQVLEFARGAWRQRKCCPYFK
jgi:hypothetical protein